MTTRRALVLAALAVQVSVVALAAAGAPFEVRLPVGLLYVLAVPGYAVIGLLRLDEPTTELALSVAVSLGVCTAAAQVLAWAGTWSLAGTLGLLALVVLPCLGAQLLVLRRAGP